MSIKRSRTMSDDTASSGSSDNGDETSISDSSDNDDETSIADMEIDDIVEMVHTAQQSYLDKMVRDTFSDLIRKMKTAQDCEVKTESYGRLDVWEHANFRRAMTQFVYKKNAESPGSNMRLEYVYDTKNRLTILRLIKREAW